MPSCLRPPAVSLAVGSVPEIENRGATVREHSMRRLRGPAPPPKYIMDSTTRLTIPEASRLLGIPLGTLRNRVARGGMPHYSIDGYHVLVDLADIVAWEPVWASGSRRGENARRVVALVVQGYSDRSIAATLAISFQRVSQLRRRAGLTPAQEGSRDALPQVRSEVCP